MIILDAATGAMLYYVERNFSSSPDTPTIVLGAGSTVNAVVAAVAYDSSSGRRPSATQFDLYPGDPVAGRGGTVVKMKWRKMNRGVVKTNRGHYRMKINLRSFGPTVVQWRRTRHGLKTLSNRSKHVKNWKLTWKGRPGLLAVFEKAPSFWKQRKQRIATGRMDVDERKIGNLHIMSPALIGVETMVVLSLICAVLESGSFEYRKASGGPVVVRSSVNGGRPSVSGAAGRVGRDCAGDGMETGRAEFENWCLP